MKMFMNIVFVCQNSFEKREQHPKMKSAGCARRIPYRLVKIWDTVSLTAKKKERKKKNIN